MNFQILRRCLILICHIFIYLLLCGNYWPFNKTTDYTILNGNIGKIQLKRTNTWSRAELINEGKGPLLEVIKQLEKSNKSELVNKATIFSYSIKSVVQILDNLENKKKTEIKNEQISIYRHKGLEYPTSSNITEVNTPNIQITSSWMNYSDEKYISIKNSEGFQTTFMDFANIRLGGGTFGSSRAQEEMLFEQSPDLAMILAIFNSSIKKSNLFTRKVTRSIPVTEARYSQIEPINMSSPILISNVRFLLKINEDNKSLSIQTRSNSPAVNIIATAAPEIRSYERGRAYPYHLLKDLFSSAITAIAMVKAYDMVHKKKTFLTLGRWGAGAFGHNLHISLAIQYLAARIILKNDDFVRFTGINESDATKSFNLVDSQIKKFLTSNQPIKIVDILRSILNEVKDNLDWNIYSSVRRNINEIDLDEFLPASDIHKAMVL